MKNWLVAQVVICLSVLACGQQEIGLTAANECRHVAILARDGFKGTHTASCFIPAQKESTTIDAISLMRVIPSEWSWVYDHQGSVSGQVVTRGEKTVTIFSQKSCVDRGKATGRPMRMLYAQVGKDAEPLGTVGDFFTQTVSLDSYADCVRNKAQWYQFKMLNNSPLPTGTVQFVRRNIGAHLGTGTFLTPYNFSYSDNDVDKAFKQAFRDAFNGTEKTPLPIKSGRPIVLPEYAFEIGLSVLGHQNTLNISTGAVVNDLHQDLSMLAWNRALQAKAALAGRVDPPPLLPEELKRAEYLSIPVLTLVSVAVLAQALKEAGRLRREEVVTWRETPSTFACITKQSEHVRSDNFFSSRTGSFGILVALISVLVALIAAVLEFYDSELRRQDTIIVSQGGSISYGSSDPNQGIDRLNKWAGSEFSVNHWIQFQIKSSGNPVTLLLIATIASCIAVVVIFLLYSFALRLEHQLDNEVVRFLTMLVKWPINLLRTLIARGFPRRRTVSSYETRFGDLCERLTTYYGHAAIEPPARNPFRVHTRYALAQFTPNGHMNTVQGGQVASAFFASGNNFVSQQSLNNAVNRNEIEKASEMLAASCFGMLNYPQVLAILHGDKLWQLVSRFINYDTPPTPLEIKQLARLYYVDQAIVPASRGEGIRPHEFTIANIEEVSRENPPPYTEERVSLCAVLGFQLPQDGENILSDGVALGMFQPDSASG